MDAMDVVSESEMILRGRAELERARHHYETMCAEAKGETPGEALMRDHGIDLQPAPAHPPKFDYQQYDPDGKELIVHTRGDLIRISIETGDGHRSALQYHELDVEDAVGLAHDLLERAYPVTGCDEIETAIVALRALADREAQYEAIGLQMAGED